MKKINTLLLIICLILGACPIDAAASEIQTKYLQVSVNEKVQTYECLWDNEEIYCSVQSLAEMSNYKWTRIDDYLEFEFFREYESNTGNYGIELQTSVFVKVDNNKKIAEIEAMNESYSVGYYIEDGEVFLPLEKLLYLLHVDLTIVDDMVYVKPMPLTILDFMAIYSTGLAQTASRSEDVLIDTGWLFSDNKWGQAVYSSVAEVFNDFDGKIFILWWPGEGHVKTAECYENAILQLAKEDKEFIGEEVQADAIEKVVNSIFSLNNEYSNKIQNIISVPQNVNDIVQSIPDAVSILERVGTEHETLKNLATHIENGEIDSSFLEIPELKSKIDELGKIGDGLAILQCVWNAYDTANRVEGWNDEYIKQLQVLAGYENPGYVNDTVAGYVQSSAQRLIDSYNAPDQAANNEALQSAIGLLLSKTFDESPFGKAFSIMGAVGACYGTFDVETTKTYDVYSDLSVVTFSIKVEQLVRELFKYEDILTTTDKLTNESIEEARNQLMLYLRLNLRNKAQLYNLNVRGNEDKNWTKSEEAKELYDEIVKVYAMLAELIETKDYDSRIILVEDLDDIYSLYPAIPIEILLDEKINSENIEISLYFEQYEQLVEKLGMKPTDYWQFPDSKSYVVDQFYLEWIDETFSIKNEGAPYVKLYGFCLGDSIAQVETTLHENEWVNYYSNDSEFSYIAILNDKEYILSVYVDNGNVIKWYLNNWPEGEDIGDAFYALREKRIMQDIKGIPEAYKNILMKYIVAFPWDNFTDYSTVIPDLPEASNLYMYNKDLSEIGYTLIDIDGNGTDELIIGDVMLADQSSIDSDVYKGMMFDAYTLMNNEAVQILASGERFIYHLCSDGSIVERWSGSAVTSGWDKWVINATGDALAFEEGVALDGYYAEEIGLIEDIADGYSQNINNSYFKYNSHEGHDGYIHISAEEAQQLIQAYEEKYVFIKYIPFSEISDKIIVDHKSILSEDEIYNRLVAHYKKGAEDDGGADLTVMEGEFDDEIHYRTSVRCGVPGNDVDTQRLYQIDVNAETGEVTQTHILFGDSVTVFNLFEELEN